MDTGSRKENAYERKVQGLDYNSIRTDHALTGNSAPGVSAVAVLPYPARKLIWLLSSMPALAGTCYPLEPSFVERRSRQGGERWQSCIGFRRMMTFRITSGIPRMARARRDRSGWASPPRRCPTRSARSMTARSIRSSGRTRAGRLPISVKAQRAEYAFMIMRHVQNDQLFVFGYQPEFLEKLEATTHKARWRRRISSRISATSAPSPWSAMSCSKAGSSGKC